MNDKAIQRAAELVQEFCRQHGIVAPEPGHEIGSPLFQFFVYGYDTAVDHDAETLTKFAANNIELQQKYDELAGHAADQANEIEGMQYQLANWRTDLEAAKKFERTRAVTLVMDLFCALREIKGRPTLRDLVKLAKRIKRN